MESDGTDVTASPLESRPAILLVGPPNVGKRTILSRLLSVDFGDSLDTSIGILCHGWSIDTKYYSADVSIWTAHLDEEFSFGSLAMADKLVALVLVFDLNDLTSFSTLKAWVSGIDVLRFDILLCIGNKVDLLPGHFAHAEYRRQLQNNGESSSDPHPEFLDYGILDTEGSSLLGEEEAPWEIRRSCLDWCFQHNIEYVEACASNVIFDRCLSVNGDVQGIERIYGALSAYMWPGMILKSDNRRVESFSEEKAVSDVSDEGSQFELEYEILSHGSADQWDDSDDSWVAFTGALSPVAKEEEASTSQYAHTFVIQDTQHATSDEHREPMPVPESMPSLHEISSNGHPQASGIEGTASTQELPTCSLLHGNEMVTDPSCSREDAEVFAADSLSQAQDGSNAEFNQIDQIYNDKYLDYDDMEHLMSEIGNMRDNLRLMPDFQRREMAAQLAIKMAAMFGSVSDGEDF